MKTKTTLKWLYLLLAVTTVLSICSCSKDHAGGSNKSADTLGYSIVTFVNSSNVAQGEFILPFDTLTSGTVSPVNYGYDVTGTFPYYGFYYHKGYYYFVQDNQLYKYTIDKSTHQFVKAAGMVFTYFTPGLAPYWVDDHTMVYVGAQGNTASYVIINADDMTVTGSGKLDIPYYSGGTVRDPGSNAVLTPSFNIFFFSVVGDKALIGYSFSTSAYPDIHGVADVNYYAEMDYPSMTNVTIKKDSRYEYMAVGENFKDENGNMYLVTANYINDSTLNGVLKINKGTYSPDDTYFLQAIDAATYKSFSFAIHTAVYVGNGLAYLAGNGQYNTNLLINVNNKTVVKDLGASLPQQEWAFANFDNAMVENNKLYFFGSGATSAIYQYDPSTDQLTKGLELNGGVYSAALLHKEESE